MTRRSPSLTPFLRFIMLDRAGLLDLIERALDSQPTCPVCGSHTKIVEDDGGLVLVCSAAQAPTSLLGRVGAAVLPHAHQLVVSAEDMRAAEELLAA